MSGIPLKLLRFVTILLAAVLATMTFTHLWQLPTRMGYGAGLWFSTLGLYEKLGPKGPGPIVEVAAVLAAMLHAVAVRRRGSAFGLSLFAALVLACSFAAWWIFIHPVNEQMAGWTPGTIPADWSVYRERWEYGHAARACCSLLALAALVWSVVRETPEGAEEVAPVGWPSTPRSVP
jgi:hypothetical protein